MSNFMLRFFLGLLLMMGGTWSELYPMNPYRALERVIACIAKPTHIPVFMNHSDIIQLNDLAVKKPIISTGGLVGCIATILYVQNEQGRLQRVLLSHYSQGNQDHLVELEAQIKRLQDIQAQFDYGHFVIIRPDGRNAFFSDKEDVICQLQSEQLQSLVSRNLRVKNLDMTSNFYKLPIPGLQMPAQVCAVLSGDTQEPSWYKIIDDNRSQRYLLANTEE